MRAHYSPDIDVKVDDDQRPDAFVSFVTCLRCGALVATGFFGVIEGRDIHDKWHENNAGR